MFHHDRPESVQGQYASLHEGETLLRQARDRMSRPGRAPEIISRPGRDSYVRWQAAVTIQKMWRGALARERAMDKWVAIWQIQRFWRGALVRYRMARWRGRPIGPVRKQRAASKRAHERELARQKRAEEREQRRQESERQNAEVQKLLARVESVRRGVIRTPSASGTPRSSFTGYAYSPDSTFGSAPTEVGEPVTPTALMMTPTSTMRSVDAPAIDPMPGQTMEVPIQMRDGSVQMLPVMVMPQDSPNRKQRNASVEETANFLMSLASDKAASKGEVESTKFLMELADQTLRLPTPNVDPNSTVASTYIALESPAKNAELGATLSTPTKPTPPPASVRKSHPGSLRGVYQRVKEKGLVEPRSSETDAGAEERGRDSFLSVPAGPASAPPSASKRGNLPPDMDDYASYVSPKPPPRPQERFAKAVEDAVTAVKVGDAVRGSGGAGAKPAVVRAKPAAAPSPEAEKIAGLQGLIDELNTVQRKLLDEIHAEFPEVAAARQRPSRRIADGASAPAAAAASAASRHREISFAPTPSPVRMMRRERETRGGEDDAMERYAAMLAGTIEKERTGGHVGAPVSSHHDATPTRARTSARFTPASSSRRSSLGSVRGSAGFTPARKPGSRGAPDTAAAAARRRAIEVEDEEEERISRRLGQVYLAGESRTRHANALVSRYSTDARVDEAMDSSRRATSYAVDTSVPRGTATRFTRTGSRGSPASILDTLRSDASDPYEQYERHSYTSHKPANTGNYWEIRQGIAKEFHSGSDSRPNTHRNLRLL